MVAASRHGIPGLYHRPPIVFSTAGVPLPTESNYLSIMLSEPPSDMPPMG